MSSSIWQFWIDVGGTFTDCLTIDPSGNMIRRKVLSSAVTKGRIGEASHAREIVDVALEGDADDFWRGYGVRLLDDQGRVVAESVVEGSAADSGRLVLKQPLSRAPRTGQSYELVSAEGAPLLAMRRSLGLRLTDPLPRCSLRLGTTRGTNALLTRKGAAAALVTTAGFADLPRIGNQNRPDIFALDIRRPDPLHRDVLEIDERIALDGTVLKQPDLEAVRKGLVELKTRGAQSLAVCLLNAYRHDRHEQVVADVARQVGFDEVSLSSEVAPLIKMVSRMDTTVLDAYLNPVLRDYVSAIRTRIGEVGSLRLLTSAGGLVAADRFRGKDSILSGPAGGVVGFSRVALAAGFSKAIGFDMGGTSTDVSRFDGRYEFEFETEKAGVRIVTPMMAIETVAAGGGSICRFDGVKPTVGPESAGADPGPACYGRGGPLTVTDVNLLSGRIQADFFPFELDLRAAEDRLRETCGEICDATGHRYSPEQLADGFLRVANANMAKAIRSISVAKGYDPRDYVLVAFGGAAAQHACPIATELGIERILNHPDAGLLSALGAGMADVVRHGVIGVYREYSADQADELIGQCEELSRKLGREVVDEGIPEDRIESLVSFDLRYRGTDSALNVERPPSGDFVQPFREKHERLYGYSMEDRPIEIVAARVECVGRSRDKLEPIVRVPPRAARPWKTVPAYFDARRRDVPLFRREHLSPGDRFEGPAIVVEQNSTTVIDPLWSAEVLSGGELLISRADDASEDDVESGNRGILRLADAREADPILLEIFNNLFAGIAEQMGITLRNTACSVNVKERLDFSCAIFTADGRLVVNAPHIPVHLGAMSETVKCLIEDARPLRPGDVLVTNDPFRGGSHLPDVTVVTPVHDHDGRLIFFTASRAHHAEIGGVSPGSMPPFSRNLAEEGIVIRGFKLVDAGVSRMDRLRELLLAGPYPTRNVDENLSDIAAQVAANRQGAGDLLGLTRRFSWPAVSAYMNHIQDAAERKMRMALERLGDGLHRFEDRMDDGTRIAVAITVSGDRAVIDFTGTDPAHPGNLNANRAIVSAAVMYCMRCLIDENIPLNEGVMSPIEIVLPECFLNPPGSGDPADCPAVVGGNVETSQRIVDVLLGALKMAGASQGTMNNVVFGDSTFGYYETICGGAGATSRGPGADAVHTHMTNTRITDPEVLEQRYPARVLEFSIRRGSGGRGTHRGGDGAVRKIRFLRDLRLSILSQRRGDFVPYGIEGGEPGLAGRNRLITDDGEVTELPGLCQTDVKTGDVLWIETPGGGGWGSSQS